MSEQTTEQRIAELERHVTDLEQRTRWQGNIMDQIAALLGGDRGAVSGDAAIVRDLIVDAIEHGWRDTPVSGDPIG